MSGPNLQGIQIHQTVWRVGFKPQPWAWPDWGYAVSGRFHGRWDDPDGEFRTMYAGASLQGCLAEVLACFRPSSETASEVDAIIEDPVDAAMYPTAPAGVLGYAWLENRIAADATLDGSFCDIGSMVTIAGLRHRFLPMAIRLGFADFDASTLKDQKAREITQAIAKALWGDGEYDGIRFASRLGDDNSLWAIYERAGEDGLISPRVSDIKFHPLTPDDPALVEVLELFNIRWEDPLSWDVRPR